MKAAAEVCDEVDNDCDGTIDDGLSCAVPDAQAPEPGGGSLDDGGGLGGAQPPGSPGASGGPPADALAGVSGSCGCSGGGSALGTAALALCLVGLALRPARRRLPTGPSQRPGAPTNSAGSSVRRRVNLQDRFTD